MNLSKQVQIYSVDTNMFYNAREMQVHNMLSRRYLKRTEIKQKIKKLSRPIVLKEKESVLELAKMKTRLTRENKRINWLKGVLRERFQENQGIRVLRDDLLHPKHIISIFDSVLTRKLQMQPDHLSEDIIVVQTYFFEILKDIITDGFEFKGERYILFTASAGQIRTKKTVFIKEKIFEENKLSLMCGLTIEDINKSKEKGMNINKFLAYLALSNSATEEWKDFNIKKTIVVEDLETNVSSLVDHIDTTTYNIERKQMDIPIPHTDGCGMMLPSVSSKSFMVRLPWVKGLLVPFDFARFAQESGNTIIKDIYGVEHDIIEEKIEIIFTKSQFKMWKYYKNWKDYQNKFRKHQCQAGKCNEEPDTFPDAKLTYQMLQTLNEMTDEELQRLSQRTVDTINAIGRDRESTLRVFGIDIEETGIYQDALQQSITTYPEMLKEHFVKDRIKEVKKSLIKRARSAKLEIDGKYSFIIPDLYAFCQYLFLKQENPEGLLENGEISCQLFEDGEELDVLRSPHLYREHAIRTNVLDDFKKEWFITKGLYISIKDPITRIIQADVDGDNSLITREPIIVECAKRMTKDIVPLYYEMAVAGKEPINNEALYKGMIAAYTGGNIGEISNNISKIWNSDKPDIDAIKWLTMQNNFVIDYAKTLFKLETPKEKLDIIKSFTNAKLPHFFKFAKDKETSQTVPLNNSVVNRLFKIIPNNRVYFSNMDLGDFDYTTLMSDSKPRKSTKIIEAYEELSSRRNFNDLRKNGIHVHKAIRDQLLTINSNEDYVTDVLIDYLYREHPNYNKEVLWKCFGWTILKNIRRNMGLCEKCGTEIEAKQAKRFCDSCAKEEKLRATRESKMRKKLNLEEK